MAVAVIIGVVAVTCGIVADSNHPDSLAFLGVMVRTTAAQIFLAGAICTWALFAALWLLSAGIRRSRERGIELRALRAAASGVDFEAEEQAAAAAAAAAAAGSMASYPNAYPGAGAHGYPGGDAYGYPGANAPGSWTAHAAAPPTGQPGQGPAVNGEGQDAPTSSDDGPSDELMAFGSREAPPEWSAPHSLRAEPDDWASRLAPSSDDAEAPRRRPSAPDYWASGPLTGLDDEPTAFGNFLGFDPLRPSAFSAAPPFFDQFTSDPLQATAEYPCSGHAASDPGDAVPPRCGPVGPALADGTSPAAGLDGVDPRRARKPFGE
nr:hypothetical protein [Actinospica robiniae]